MMRHLDTRREEEKTFNRYFKKSLHQKDFIRNVSFTHFAKKTFNTVKSVNCLMLCSLWKSIDHCYRYELHKTTGAT